MAKQQGVIPSGSMSVNDVPANQDNTSSNDKTSDGNRGDAQGKEKGSENYLGSWKTKEEAAKGISELQKKMSDQGSEVGALRKQNKELFEAFTQAQKQQQAPTDPKTDTGKELENVLSEYSKLDFVEDAKASQKGAELMQKAMALTAQKVKADVLAEAGGQVQNLLQEKDAASMMNSFYEANPDFAELQEQGAFQALKSKNPMHDDLSAYYEHRANTAQAEISELKQALEEAQRVANLAGGDDRASKVFSKPGGDLRPNKQNKPQTVSELKQSALAAITSLGKG